MNQPQTKEQAPIDQPSLDGVASLEALAEEDRLRVSKARRQLDKARQEYAPLRKQLEYIEHHLDAIKDGLCPTCHRSAPELHDGLIEKYKEILQKTKTAYANKHRAAMELGIITEQLNFIDTRIHMLLIEQRKQEASDMIGEKT